MSNGEFRARLEERDRGLASNVTVWKYSESVGSGSFCAESLVFTCLGNEWNAGTIHEQFAELKAYSPRSIFGHLSRLRQIGGMFFLKNGIRYGIRKGCIRHLLHL